MELNVTKKDDLLEVQLKGTEKIYILNQEQIKNELEWCNTIYHKELVLDLTGIRFIDTTGFRLLIELNNLYKNSDKELLFHNVSDEVQELFELVNVNELFKRYEPKERLSAVAA
jgi:anti-anti-sigma factor